MSEFPKSDPVQFIVKNNFRFLPTQQKNIRHLNFVSLKNLNIGKVYSDLFSKFQVFFSLHSNKSSNAFYISEMVKCSMNLSWKHFNLSTAVKSDLVTSTKEFYVYVWCQKPDKLDFLTLWHVNLSGLTFIGTRLEDTSLNFALNTLVFSLKDGFYTIPNESSSSVPVDQCVIEAESSLVRKSYNLNSLLRINTIRRATVQTSDVSNRVKRSITQTITKTSYLLQKKYDREALLRRVTHMKNDLEWRRCQLKQCKDYFETSQLQHNNAETGLKNRHEHLDHDKQRLRDKKASYYQTRETFVKSSAKLVMRRKHLISELAAIYPIAEMTNQENTICGIKLPNSEDFAGQDEIMIMVALGNTTQLVNMISLFLDVPLRYPLTFLGSRSTIRDHILDKLTDRERDFPLYSKGKERFQFNYAVYLLNKNIAQLRYYCGLGTTDLRLTLPNLRSLFELRLGVKFSNFNTVRNVSRDDTQTNFDDKTSTENPNKIELDFLKEPIEKSQNANHPCNDHIHQNEQPLFEGSKDSFFQVPSNKKTFLCDSENGVTASNSPALQGKKNSPISSALPITLHNRPDIKSEQESSSVEDKANSYGSEFKRWSAGEMSPRIAKSSSDSEETSEFDEPTFELTAVNQSVNHGTSRSAFQTIKKPPSFLRHVGPDETHVIGLSALHSTLTDSSSTEKLSCDDVRVGSVKSDLEQRTSSLASATASFKLKPKS